MPSSSRPEGYAPAGDPEEQIRPSCRGETWIGCMARQEGTAPVRNIGEPGPSRFAWVDCHERMFPCLLSRLRACLDRIVGMVVGPTCHIGRYLVPCSLDPVDSPGLTQKVTPEHEYPRADSNSRDMSEGYGPDTLEALQRVMIFARATGVSGGLDRQNGATT